MFEWLSSGVELERDVSVADWILSGLEPWDMRGLQVGSLLPAGFDTYARVFHRVESWGGTVDTFRTWGEIGAERGVSLSPEISFAEVVGHAGDDPVESSGLAPDQGRLPDDACRTLATILSRHTATPNDCWFGLWAGWGDLLPGALLRRVPTTRKERRDRRRVDRRERREMQAARQQLDTIPKARAGHGRDYLIFHGSIEAASSFKALHRLISPSLWWPQDRAWVVATEIDGFSTYVGGSRDSIDEIVGAPALEAIEVTRSARID